MEHVIRADYDRSTIVVYQAYSAAIALPALERQSFVPPFSYQRMTWIKPSYLWLMARSDWGTKPGQEHILAVRITRTGWEEALSQAELTTGDVRGAPVLGQWDPERSLRGGKLAHRSIQVGLSRHVIRRYAEEWVREIRDYTPLTRKIRELCRRGNWEQAERHLPPERLYPVPPDIACRLGMEG